MSKLSENELKFYKDIMNKINNQDISSYNKIDDELRIDLNNEKGDYAIYI